MKKKTTEQFVIEAITVHQTENGEPIYDYSKTLYNGKDKKVIITCKTHGDFEQCANSHIQGNGCKKCAIELIALKRKLTKDQFIEKAKYKHGDRYDYSKVIYINSTTKVIIVCDKHGDFEQTPNDHYAGGCYKCGRILLATKRLLHQNEIIERFVNIHGDKYDYSLVNYTGIDNNIVIICDIHGEFEQSPQVHIMGCGCQNCGIIKYSSSKKMTTQQIIEKAKYKHGDRYDYSKTIYCGIYEPIIIICKKHGEFLQKPNNHINAGAGCHKCMKVYNYTRQDFINRCFEIYGNKNNYDNIIYYNLRTPIDILCKEHGEFTKIPSKHLLGRGCPKCKLNGCSKKQITWLELLIKLNKINIRHKLNDYEFNIPTTRYFADGFCEETNTIYEFHGDYWHGNPKRFNPNELNNTTNMTFGELYQKTLEREQIIREMGFNLVVMWESDWNKINNSIRTLQMLFRNSKHR